MNGGGIGSQVAEAESGVQHPRIARDSGEMGARLRRLVHRDVAPGFRAHRDFEVAAGPQLVENHLVVGIVLKPVCRYQEFPRSVIRRPPG